MTTLDQLGRTSRNAVAGRPVLCLRSPPPRLSVYFGLSVTRLDSSLTAKFANSPLAIDLNKEFSSFQELSWVKYLCKTCLSDVDLRRFKELFLLAVDRSPYDDITTKDIYALDLETRALLYSERYEIMIEDWDERPAPGEEEDREYQALLVEAIEYGSPPVPVYEANLQQFFDPL